MTGPDRFDSLVAALTELGEGVAVVDLKTERYLSVNDALAAMYGYAREELLELPALKGASSDRYETRVTRKDGERVIAEERRLERGERLAPNEYRMFTRSGGRLWISDDAVLRPQPERGMLLLDGLMADITDRKTAESRLQHLADHDALTGL